MIYELLLKGIYSYKELLSQAFPFMLLGLCLAINPRVKVIMSWFIVVTVLFQFIPSWDNIKESYAIHQMEERQESREFTELCNARNQSKNRLKNRYAKN